MVPAKEVIGVRTQQEPATRIRVIVDPLITLFPAFQASFNDILR